jgi:hypothetical protein
LELSQGGKVRHTRARQVRQGGQDRRVRAHQAKALKFGEVRQGRQVRHVCDRESTS